MRRRLRISGLIILAFPLPVLAQDSKDFILAAHRSGTAELIDPATLKTVTRLYFDFHVDQVSAGPEGFSLDIDGYRQGDGCCERYTLDLGTLALTEKGPRDGYLTETIQSPDRRWRFRLRTFRGPALEITDLTTGAMHELTPSNLPLTEEECGGNWAAEGAWARNHFYFYTECPLHPGLLWAVSPTDSAFGKAVKVGQFGEAPACYRKLPVDKILIGAGGKLLLYESFGGTADRSDCPTPLPGGVWVVDPETGELKSQIGSAFHFFQVIPAHSGSIVFGVDPGDAAWSQPVQLVAIDVAKEKVVASRSFDPGPMQISVGPLKGVPKGDIPIASPKVNR